MKKIVAVLVAIFMIASLTACGGKNNDAIGGSGQGNNTTENEAADKDTNDSNASDNASATSTSETDIANSTADSQPDDTNAGTKILVAYFSATGNTKKLAEYAADVTEADLYEIVPQEPYSDADLDYGDKNSRSTREMDDSFCRPAISGSVSGMEDYDIIFIAYPNWWASIPMPIASFLEEYDFSGKTIVSFCSHGGGRFGQSLTAIAKLAPDAVMGEGLSIHYSGGSSLGDDVAAWLRENGIE
ncbi:MAG: NAD(P)H-dependent oxidoreductase [Clostridium sp.]|nr:NAD(P)H-dependent oxidoreductase [Clostridium sp.]MCM1172986.1 NAD(P)H-dependent oxidoreductase [Clostridium sp.]MCM1208478.1 NAD(P)H-dependent oxidoreductase [Ruminococcus sp.]